MPFPWAKNGAASDERNAGSKQPSATNLRNGVQEPYAIAPRARTGEQNEHPPEPLRAVYEECKRLGSIVFKIPPHGSTSGVALRHAVQVLERLFQKQDPAIFKFGFTHNPVWRWSNSMYGYRFDRDKWTEMILLFVSKEAAGPAMMEAALIEKFRSFLASMSLSHGFLKRL